MENEPEVETSGKDDKGGKGKGSSSFVFPKEEEMNEDDYDRMMEERYKPGSGFVRYAADDVKSSIEMDALVPTAHDPPIWKIKCAVCENLGFFCLCFNPICFFASADFIWFYACRLERRSIQSSVSCTNLSSCGR